MLKPIGFSKPPYYLIIPKQPIWGNAYSSPQPDKLKWPSRIFLLGVLALVTTGLPVFSDRPIIFKLGGMIFLILSAPMTYIFFWRTARDLSKPPH